MQAVDVVYAYKQVSFVVSTLRRDSSTEFKRIFDERTNLGQDLYAVANLGLVHRVPVTPPLPHTHIALHWTFSTHNLHTILCVYHFQIMHITIRFLSLITRISC